MQTPIRVAFYFASKLFSTHKAETFQYARPCVTMWCIYSMLICWTITWWSHSTTWSTFTLLSGSLMWGGRPGHPRSFVLLLPCLNLVHQSNTAICCKLSLSHTCFIWEWMSACLALSAHRNWMTAPSMLGQIHDCPPISNKLLCRDHAEQPYYNVCLSQSVMITTGQHKND
jgi:hypothetical protein